MTILDIFTSIQLANILQIVSNVFLSCSVIISIICIALILINIKIKNAIMQKLSIKLIKSGIVLWIILLISVLYGSFLVSFNKNISAYNNRSPLEIKPGKVLFLTDNNVSPKDYNVKVLSDNTKVTIEIWDYAAEDGDTIQVYADNEAYTEAFKITNSPVKLSVPAASNIKIKGINCGSQGQVTYAIYFDDSKQTFINSVSNNSYNRYNLTTN